MGQSAKHVAVMDAQIKSSKEEYGANCNPNDESTAFALYFESELEKTTATYPNQRDSGSSSNQAQGTLPAGVVLCGAIAEN